MSMSGQELIKTLLKVHLHLLLFDNLYKPRVGNRQKSHVKLDDTQNQGSFDKNCLNMLEA